MFNKIKRLVITVASIFILMGFMSSSLIPEAHATEPQKTAIYGPITPVHMIDPNNLPPGWTKEWRKVRIIERSAFSLLRFQNVFVRYIEGWNYTDPNGVYYYGYYRGNWGKGCVGGPYKIVKEYTTVERWNNF